MKGLYGNSGSDEKKEVPKLGTYPARLVGFYNIGLQAGFDPKVDEPKNQAVLTYELLGKDKREDGKTFQVSEFLTLSVHQKATLPKRLEVLGAPINKKSNDWYELDETFLLSNLLGEPCMVQVGYTSTGNAKVLNVIQPMEGLTVPEPTVPLGYLDLDADDWLDNYNTAPKFIQAKVDGRLDSSPI